MNAKRLENLETALGTRALLDVPNNIQRIHSVLSIDCGDALTDQDLDDYLAWGADGLSVDWAVMSDEDLAKIADGKAPILESMERAHRDGDQVAVATLYPRAKAELPSLRILD